MQSNCFLFRLSLQDIYFNNNYTLHNPFFACPCEFPSFYLKHSFRILYVCTIPRTSLFYTFLCFLSKKVVQECAFLAFKAFSFNESGAYQIFHTTSCLGITILHNKYLQQYNCIFSLSQSSNGIDAIKIILYFIATDQSCNFFHSQYF